MNLLRNEVIRRITKKNTSESEKQLMTQLKENDEKAKTGKDPDATFFSVIVSNMFAYLQLQAKAIIFTSNTEVKCDMEVIKILAQESLHSLMEEQRMNY